MNVFDNNYTLRFDNTIAHHSSVSDKTMNK